MQKINYSLQTEAIIKQLQTTNTPRPRLLLHSCCAPCSSYVLEYLHTHFDLTVFYYNPNIAPRQEFLLRAEEQQRLIAQMALAHPPQFLLGAYDDSAFFALAKGLEQEAEGGERCRRCFTLRLEETARMAKAEGYDYFTTTLSISPHKNAQVLNEIAHALGEQYDVAPLPADFKKKGGYLRSCALSETYGLYRQSYCGCPFSKAQRETQGGAQ